MFMADDCFEVESLFFVTKEAPTDESINQDSEILRILMDDEDDY
jgi:hypothetical protein